MATSEIIREIVEKSKHAVISELEDVLRQALSLFNGNICEMILQFRLVSYSDTPAIIDSIGMFPKLCNDIVMSPNLPELIATLKGDDDAISSIFQVFKSTFGEDHNVLDKLALQTCDALQTASVRLIASNDIAMADTASTITTMIVRHACDSLPRLVSIALEHDTDSTISLRYATVIAKLIGTGEDHFQSCREHGAVDIILKLCRSRDVLVQVVALELLSEFVVTRNGFHYLVEEGIFDWLGSIVFGSSSSIDPILSSHVLCLLGSMFAAASLKQTVDWSPWQSLDERLIDIFCSSMIDQLTSSAEEKRLAGLYAVTEFSRSSIFGLNTVLSNRELMEAWAGLFSSKVDIQAAALNSLARVLDVSYPSESMTASLESGATDGAPTVISPDRNRDIDRKKAQLFESLGSARAPTALAFLLKLIRQPIAQLRNGALNILRSLAEQPGGWGLQIIFSSQEFREFILNQNSESSSDGRQWKFAVVQAAAKNPQVDLLGEDLPRELRKAEARGPNYIVAQTGDLLTMER